jgi:hypothetical protein
MTTTFLGSLKQYAILLALRSNFVAKLGAWFSADLPGQGLTQGPSLKDDSHNNFTSFHA